MFRLYIITLVIVCALSEQLTCPSISGVGYVESLDPQFVNKPFVDGSFTFTFGNQRNWSKRIDTVTSPIQNHNGDRIPVGQIARMSEEDALEALESAKSAWKKGQGTWPQMKLSERISVIESIITTLIEKRSQIISVLMWEICKNEVDAALEFDRTIEFIRESIKVAKELDSSPSSMWKSIRGVLTRVRLAAIGIVLCLGPFNYPFNETYATLFPALLAGNVVIMKIPTIGGLVHMLTAEAYAKHLPPGVLTFVTGSGRETMPALMKSGAIDVLAFIGGKNAADALIKSHPSPHRLKLFLQLEGKNLGIVLPDADLDVAAEQVTIGSTSFNGQRCTAIKLVLVHRSVIEAFLPKLISKIASLKVGLPWEKDVQITPLPEADKPAYLRELIDDAVSHGAKVVNEECGGGQSSGSLITPAILYPVQSSMRIWTEEQFGPVIPVGVFDDIAEVTELIGDSSYGLQAAVFTKNAENSSHLIDILSTAVGRININTQCGRSPDVVPFTGRRSSALGAMSIYEALREFSIQTVVAAKDNAINDKILKDYEKYSNFLSPLE